MAAREKAAFRREKKIFAMAARMDLAGESLTLLYPEVFMNVSGEIVRKLKDLFPVNPQLDLLVVVDDAALPFGALRLRPRGSSGGHNGLKSLAQALGGDDFSRLRMGIGHPGHGAPLAEDEEAESPGLQDYVLDPFLAEEEKQMSAVFQRAEEACRLWAVEPIERAMNAVNPKPTKG